MDSLVDLVAFRGSMDMRTLIWPAEMDEVKGNPLW
jgi:hypothetical protein